MDFWESIIGLEIHIELKTKSKMFCRCSADYFGREPNTHCCPVCLGLPGALPVANKKAVEWTVLAGLALGCKIPLFSKFDRKNYFYPDLPKGYQISQYDLPLAVNGQLKFEIRPPSAEPRRGRGNSKFEIRIRRVHLEEDTAKLLHPKKKRNTQYAIRNTENMTLIDFNRSGVPLMEVVTEPDIGSPQEAKEFLKKLQQIVRYLGISDCDMEKGSLRIEPNVSVRRGVGKVTPLPRCNLKRLPAYKVEIKNINSFRFAERAIDYEIKRQIKLFKQGKKPVQETRGWNEIKQATYSQRVKEAAQDYRYFPEPDLPPIRWKKLEINKLRNLLPELPDEKATRFEKRYGLSADQVRILIATREKADYFEEAVKAGKKHLVSARELANVIINKRVNIKKFLPAELVQALVKKKAKPKVSKKELEKIINEVIKENFKAVGDYKKGKENAIMFLVGQAQRKTSGATDPQAAREIILKKLKEKR